MNILLLTSHAIAEHDDLDMFTRMGVPCYSIGGAYDEVPFEGKRPALPNVIRYPELEAATSEQRARLAHDLGDPGPNIDWAKARLAPAVLDWADTIIVHHFPEQWIGGQWDRIREKRVIWRTCGQSDPRLEHSMSWLADHGLQVVRYSPKEREAFATWGSFAGEDALIRFGKDPAEWSGWTGDDPVVGNITQHMQQRGDACGYPFWEEATQGLPVRPAGPGSEVMRGGIGSLDFDAMKDYLRACRVYLYTGTRPASYTLGLIEAMMTGTPVVSIVPADFGEAGPLLEAHDLTYDHIGNAMRSDRANGRSRTRAEIARRSLLDYLDHPNQTTSGLMRQRAIELFGLEGVMRQWRDFLGLPEPFAGWQDRTPPYFETAA